MTLRLTVRAAEWRAHVTSLVATVPGLIPVVKGNGYGFGRDALAAIADELTASLRPVPPIAVGTVYEASSVPAGRTPLVLAPHLGSLPSSLPADAVVCVGAIHHVEALRDAGWRGRAHLKLRSSMQRYGAPPTDVPAIAAAARAAGIELVATTLHLPLVGDDESRAAEVERWLDAADPTLPLSVSHLAPVTFAELRRRHPDRQLHLRVGTALWHGDKATLSLQADVVDVTPTVAGDMCGYRAVPLPADGTVVVVGAGSAHGVAPLADGRSPLHFARRRLELVEPPHMHTTMAFVPRGDPCPRPGEWVDVQRPLTGVQVDEVSWE